MYSKVKIAGHPLHPMLVGFPVTLYAVTLGCFTAYALGADVFWFRVGAYANLAGVILAAVAAIPGFIDWALGVPRAVPRRPPAWRTWRATCSRCWPSAGISCCMAPRLFPEPRMGLSVVLPALGVLLTLAAGYLGWKIVQKHHVGVDLTPEQERLEPRASPRPSATTPLRTPAMADTSGARSRCGSPPRRSPSPARLESDVRGGRLRRRRRHRRADRPLTCWPRARPLGRRPRRRPGSAAADRRTTAHLANALDDRYSESSASTARKAPGWRPRATPRRSTGSRQIVRERAHRLRLRAARRLLFRAARRASEVLERELEPSGERGWRCRARCARAPLASSTRARPALPAPGASSTRSSTSPASRAAIAAPAAGSSRAHARGHDRGRPPSPRPDRHGPVIRRALGRGRHQHAGQRPASRSTPSRPPTAPTSSAPRVPRGSVPRGALLGHGRPVPLRPPPAPGRHGSETC